MSELLINSGVYVTDKLPVVIKPMDLLEIENKIFVYEGLINEENYIDNYYGLFNYQKLTKAIAKLIP